MLDDPSLFRLLAVDDEAGMLTLYQDILEPGEGIPLPPESGARDAPLPTGGLRFELTLCGDGRDAAETVRRAREEGRPFAVVLVDVRLRGGPDGVWTAETIRRLDPNVEIVMVTAYSDVGLEELNRRVPPPGKLLYLQKPFRPQELRQMAISLCGKWRSEQELRALRATLASRVEQRLGGRKALEEQLRQAQKMEALGTLAGGIAHDFNNILGVMLGYAELIREGAQDTGLRRRVDEIMHAGARARDLVNQILNFSRQGPQERGPLKLIPMIKEAMKLLRPGIPMNVAIRTEFDAEEDTALADPTQFHQIVLNLCTNAAQAMGERGGELVIRLADADDSAPAQVHDPRWFLHLSVADTGPGMEPEVLERIFEPFFTTKAPGQGTGLGLSVVHGIVKTHEGAIGVESEPGRGSVFHVYLPRARAEAAPLPAPLPALHGAGGRVLLVDDEKPLVDIARELLEGFGFTVTARTSSVEALEAFRFRPEAFDLAITDYAMPNMSGVELSQELRKLRPDLPVILCTGFSETISVERARSLGFCDVIMKPILKNELVRSVNRLLEGPEIAPPHAD